MLELKNRIEALKIRHKEREQVDIKKREEEMKFLSFQRDHLTTFFKQIDEK